MIGLGNDPETRLSRFGQGLHAAGLAVSVALFSAVYVPAVGALHSEQTRISDKIDAAARLAGSADTLHDEHRDLVQRQAETQARTAQLLGRIPDSPQESEFLAHIARLARTASLSIRSFRPIATQTHERYSEIEVQLSAAGTWPGLCRFLAGLETLPRLCRVTRLSIASEKSVGGIYPAEFTFAIYFAPGRQEPSAAGPEDAVTNTRSTP